MVHPAATMLVGFPLPDPLIEGHQTIGHPQPFPIAALPALVAATLPWFPLGLLNSSICISTSPARKQLHLLMTLLPRRPRKHGSFHYSSVLTSNKPRRYASSGLCLSASTMGFLT
jgi:hypothetical protein